ncbi:periodic tryptophan protein 2 homolog isoform X2 [Thunnus maccoyii]|uniref:periodic tryptophan protein 2 homolog isoform X2 n=1 Tax=Thunnus maccoyii TaxID=8240 RepID=UPI001C4D9ACC|nr:periodic tryptophan protein 2 homolog isoform X2 [Thunnus maccoyii]
MGQLLVWEWQSELFVFKQQGHFNNVASLAYSPDGQHIVTGGDDGKVKVWNTNSGLCFVTFTEHTSSVTNVTFTSSGFVIVSASLDGTVRAFDLHRYRNFWTFTSLRPAQFSSLVVDVSGELVSAGAQDSSSSGPCRQADCWRSLGAMRVQSAACASVQSSPVHLGQSLVGSHHLAVGHDGQLAVKETLPLTSDGLSVTYRSDGQELAVATLNGEISFWNPHTATQNGSVAGRHDRQMKRQFLTAVCRGHVISCKLQK